PEKNPRASTVGGKPLPRVDIPAKVTGTFTYMQDFRRPGMLQARVVRPPAIKADLQSFDDAEARKIPGYVATVRKGNFLAAVAKGEWAAIRGAGAVKAKWSDWTGLPDAAKLRDHVRAAKAAKGEVSQNVGEGEAGMKRPGAKTLAATSAFAIHTHGSIGPSCAVAEMKDGKLTVWTASQATHLLRKQLAHMLGMKT